MQFTPQIVSLPSSFHHRRGAPHRRHAAQHGAANQHGAAKSPSPMTLLARGARIFAVLLYAGAQIACLSIDLGGNGGGNNGGSSTGSSTGDRSTGGQSSSGSSTGTAPVSTCNGWKIAYCDSIDACDAFTTREECETDIGYIRCLDDIDFGTCVSEIEAAIESESCNALPGNCRPKDVADRTEPTLACQQIAEAHCEWALTCGSLEGYDACMARLNKETPCEDYLAVLPGVDECLSAYLSHPCDAVTPDECRGLLRD